MPNDVKEFLIPLRKTERGFVRGEFPDAHQDPCSIQESSFMGGPFLLLGLEKGEHTEGHCLARMLVDRERAGALSKLLAYFAEHGELPPE